MLRWLTWNQWFYWIAGVLIMVLSIFVAIETLEKDALRAEAAAAPQPAGTPVAQFDPEHHVYAAEEVALIGELRRDLIEAWDAEGAVGIDMNNWAAPLVPTGEEFDGVVRLLVLEDGYAIEAPIAAWLKTPGLGGAQAPVRGFVSTKIDKDQRAHLERQYARRDLALADEIFVIEPFLKSRAEELEPDGLTGAPALVAGFGLFVFGFGFLRRWMKRRRIEFG